MAERGITITVETDDPNPPPPDIFTSAGEQALKDLVAAAELGLEGANSWIGDDRVDLAMTLVRTLADALNHRGNL